MVKLLFAFIIINFSIASINGQAKLSYVYDEVGNRVERVIVLLKDSPNLNKATTPHYFEETLSKRQIKFYPNPVKTILTIDLGSQAEGCSAELMLYDEKGKLLLQSKIENSITDVDMNNYPSGNYLMDLLLNGEKTSWKVIKK